MLQKVHIINFAIIDDLQINFSTKLNIITGETGAGKSILMHAINLILGQRAESNVLLNKEKKCIIECVFTTNNNTKEIQSFFLNNDVDYNQEIIIRREIAPNGKSRAFINDTPANLNQLKELGTLLIDLHQQFDTLDLGKNDFQTAVVDAMAGNTALLANYTTVFGDYNKKQAHLQQLLLQQQVANASADFNQYLFDELAASNFKTNELELLDEELKLLTNAESIKQVLTNTSYELAESEEPVIKKLKLTIQKLHTVEKYQPAVQSIVERLQSVLVELQDIAAEIDIINGQIVYNPAQILQVNDKVTLGYKLLKKHNVHTTNELIDVKNLLQQKLLQVVNLNEEISIIEHHTKQLYEDCVKIANQIHAKRIKAIEPFVKKVNELLHQVGMPNAAIKIMIEKVALNENGNDTISFYFDANNANRFESLQKVASGGELSRLMLCIKYLVAQELQLPTLIFDEIDTGISGEAAKQVGIMMQSLSKNHQLLAITHQPQIAAKANAHYYVYKSTNKLGSINTAIKLLNEAEKIDAIAKMISGDRPTLAAIENAKELVNNN